MLGWCGFYVGCRLSYVGPSRQGLLLQALLGKGNTQRVPELALHHTNPAVEYTLHGSVYPYIHISFPELYYIILYYVMLCYIILYYIIIYIYDMCVCVFIYLSIYLLYIHI